MAKVVEIHEIRQGKLFEVAIALDRLRLGFGARKRREQHAGEDRDDGNHHEQLNQGETPLGSALRSVVHFFPSPTVGEA